MKAEIIATGTEILLGQTLNTSAHYITGKLSELGIEVDYHTTVGDNKDRLENVIRQGIERSDLIIITGGTGPTVDDLSKEIVAKVLGLNMVLDPASLEKIRQFFSCRGASMPDTEKKQALFPEGSQILPNNHGTAPGVIVSKSHRTIIILPGPPHEMEPMFDEFVWPVLQKMADEDVQQRMVVRVLKVFGLGESDIEKELQDLMGQENPSMTLLAKHAEMHIRLVARGETKAVKEALNRREEQICQRLGEKVFAKNKETMIDLVSQGLKNHQLSIATAESCTGGLLGSILSQEPGSSEFFLGGVVSYSNSLKEKFLGVPTQTLADFGAVSAETAKEMAEGIRNSANSDLGVSITGIAGPSGGSKNKPVGLVYIGFASPEGVQAYKFQFHGGRDSIRQLSVQAALDWVRRYLVEFERRK